MLPDSISYISADETGFPQLLKHIGSPPKGLFVRGELDDRPAISIVGTRQNTPYGKRCVAQLVAPLVEAGFTIVSGLALGIDGLVHKAALDAGGKTIAVLGTGIDNATIYPRAHLNLAHQIIESGGAIVSEFKPGTPSRKEHFPIRNRLIAGWSMATMVIEADTNSGSLITARQALENNREVLAVPGPINSSVSSGCHALIKSGARLCENVQDVFDAIKLDRPAQIAETRKLLPLTPEESLVYRELASPIHADDLQTATGLDSAKISAALSMLELKSYAIHSGGQIWSRLRK